MTIEKLSGGTNTTGSSSRAARSSLSIGSIRGDMLPVVESVLADEWTRELEIVHAFVMTIEPRTASAWMKKLASALPLSELDHLRRIKRDYGAPNDDAKGDSSRHAGTAQVLHVLVGRVSDHADEEGLRTRLTAVGLPFADLRVAPVPRHAPKTRAQLEHWRQLWPLDFHDTGECVCDGPVAFTDAQLLEIKAYMTLAIKQAKAAESSGM
ncbi:hypothetical protein HK405_000860, partial [Cladochytrium tenue]